MGAFQGIAANRAFGHDLQRCSCLWFECGSSVPHRSRRWTRIDIGWGVQSELCWTRVRPDADKQDILLISSSVLFFGSTITPVQIFGEWSGRLAHTDHRLLSRVGWLIRVQECVWQKIAWYSGYSGERMLGSPGSPHCYRLDAQYIGSDHPFDPKFGPSPLLW